MILRIVFASLRSANFLTPILLSTTSTSHILTCPHFLLLRQFREQMKEISGSREMSKIIKGAHKVNLGSSDKEKLREQGAEGQILKGAEDPPCRVSLVHHSMYMMYKCVKLSGRLFILLLLLWLKMSQCPYHTSNKRRQITGSGVGLEFFSLLESGFPGALHLHYTVTSNCNQLCNTYHIGALHPHYGVSEKLKNPMWLVLRYADWRWRDQKEPDSIEEKNFNSIPQTVKVELNSFSRGAGNQ